MKVIPDINALLVSIPRKSNQIDFPRIQILTIDEFLAIVK